MRLGSKILEKVFNIKPFFYRIFHRWFEIDFWAAAKIVASFKIQKSFRELAFKCGHEKHGSVHDYYCACLLLSEYLKHAGVDIEPSLVDIEKPRKSKLPISRAAFKKILNKLSVLGLIERKPSLGYRLMLKICERPFWLGFYNYHKLTPSQIMVVNWHKKNLEERLYFVENPKFFDLVRQAIKRAEKTREICDCNEWYKNLGIFHVRECFYCETKFFVLSKHRKAYYSDPEEKLCLIPTGYVIHDM